MKWSLELCANNFYDAARLRTISQNIEWRIPQGQSAVDTEAINDQHKVVITSVDPGGDWMIDTERINSQLSLLCEKIITFVDRGRDWRPWDIPCVARVDH